MVESNSESNDDLHMPIRRSFLHTTSQEGATVAISPKKDAINVAVLGTGDQGGRLIDACLRMGRSSGIRFVAICDILPYGREHWAKVLKAYKHDVNTYEDYAEMLDNQADLDAVIVATPNFCHADHTIAALEKGLHVYCENVMADSIDKAGKMVLAERKAEKLLQIGHQRRSNPRYTFAYEKLIKEAKLLSGIKTVNGQWNSSRFGDSERKLRTGQMISDEKLGQYGYESMKHLLNWRWYKELGGGPVVELGAQQLDVYRWFLGARPKSVMATGGVDYSTESECCQDAMAIIEFDTDAGAVRASYQISLTNGAGDCHETFMGAQGTLDISELNQHGCVYNNSSPGMQMPEQWDNWVKAGYVEHEGAEGSNLNSGPGGDIGAMEYSYQSMMPRVPFYQPHLENFFDAIRGEAELNCPGEVGYEAAVMAHKLCQAAQECTKIVLTPEDFEIAA